MSAQPQPVPPVVIYTTSWCPYCHRAKALLQQKRVHYTEIDIDREPSARADMVERSGRTSVPQVFIDDEPIGGSDELHALERSGELDRLLGRDGS